MLRDILHGRKRRGAVARRIRSHEDDAVEHHYRNQKLLDIGEGTSEVRRVIIARNMSVPGRSMQDYARIPCAIRGG